MKKVDKGTLSTEEKYKKAKKKTYEFRELKIFKKPMNSGNYNSLVQSNERINKTP